MSRKRSNSPAARKKSPAARKKSPAARKKSPGPAARRRSPGPAARRRSPSPVARSKSRSPAARTRSPSPVGRRRSQTLAEYRMKRERKAPDMHAIDAAGKKKPTRGNDGNLWISQPDLRGVYRWNKFNDPFIRMV